MQLGNGEHTLDAYRPTFDPNLGIATVVFSHVQCVKTRHSLARVGKLWRDASKPAAAYPLRFDFDAFTQWTVSKGYATLSMLDNDEALSLPYERVVGLLGEYTAEHVCNYAAPRGSVRLLKWTRVNNWAWSRHTCNTAASHGHLPALKYLHENGCPWDEGTCYSAVYLKHLDCVLQKHLDCVLQKHWDCLQYAVDNKCPGWEHFAEKHAEHLR